MADLKISELTEAPNAVSGDKVIINKGDLTTQKIDVANLIGGSLGGDAYYQPQYIPFTTHVPETSYGPWRDVPGTNGGVDRLDDIFVSEVQTVTMPAGADGAIVMYFFFDSWGLNTTAPEGTEVFPWRQYTNHAVTVSGSANPLWVTGEMSGEQKDTMGCVVTHNVTIGVNASSTNKELRRANLPTVKFDSIKFNGSDTGTTDINFQCSIDLIKGGHNVWGTNFGRLLVIPFKTSTTFSAPEFPEDPTTIFYTSADKNDILNSLFPPLTSKQLATDSQVSILDQMQLLNEKCVAHIYGYETNGVADPDNKLPQIKALQKNVMEMITTKAAGLTEAQAIAQATGYVQTGSSLLEVEFEFYTNA